MRPGLVGQELGALGPDLAREAARARARQQPATVGREDRELPGGVPVERALPRQCA
mgnify:CR=1 FL=1